jgi:hypothetical protein
VRELDETFLQECLSELRDGESVTIRVGTRLRSKVRDALEALAQRATSWIGLRLSKMLPMRALAYPLVLTALLGYFLYSALTEPPPAYPPGSPACTNSKTLRSPHGLGAVSGG